jgi:flagellar biosynthetic protein FliQ
MEIGEAVTVLRGGIMQVVVLSAPILLIAMAVGLVVSIIQATTSIQEQTLTFVPKIAAILIALFLLFGWMLGSLREYSVNLFQGISEIR